VVEFKPDDMPNVPDDLFPKMVEETCLAVAAYIGISWGWKIVVLEMRGSGLRDKARMETAWARLPESSRAIIMAEAGRSGYKGEPTRNLLPLVWRTKRQREALRESIVSIAMRAIAHEDWLKR
jgi:hypothetical protein